MDIDQARQDILSWIENFVERPNANLNGWPPCPYARRARLDNMIDIRSGTVEPYTDLRLIEMQHHDVIVLVYDAQEFDGADFDHQVHQANLAFLAGKDMIAMADHPAVREEVNGVCMNQGQWALVFVQRLSQLNRDARILASKDFYQGWSEDYLAELFRGREDPRQ